MTKHILTRHIKKVFASKKRLVLFLILGLGLALIFMPLLNRVQDQIVMNGMTDTKTFTPGGAQKNEIVKKVNMLIGLPTDTDVVVGTISDVNRLGWRAQYLKKAVKGDNLLIFPHMTIIYDAKTNTIRDISTEDLLHKDEPRREYLKKQS